MTFSVGFVSSTAVASQTGFITTLRASKMSMAGWWMVHAMVRPVSTMLRTTRMTIAAARASRPAHGERRPQLK